MVRKSKYAVLAGAVVAAAMASQAQAGFTYDLRFAPGTVGLAATDLTNHTVNLGATGATYTLQLWGQISGDTSQTNDGWASGYVNAIVSSQTSGGAFSAGGITSNGTALGSNVQAPAGSPIVGIGGTDITSDGVTDWGNQLSSSTVKANWLKWVGGANPGFIPNGTTTESQRVDANTWEVLLATFTVTPTGALGTGSTTFTPFETASVKLSGTSTVNSLGVYVDTAAPTVGAQTTTVSANNGATFAVVPEPASLGVLAVGGLALLARKRRRA